MRKKSHLSQRESGGVQKSYKKDKVSGRGKSGKNLHIQLIISAIKKVRHFLTSISRAK